MATVHEVIEAFRQAPSNSERGTKFEKLMVRYFELDPMLASTYDKVWRWIDWPDRKGKPDTGIDLVAQMRDTGELTAVQCKFYEPTHTLAKADIDSFFTASGKAPFTNRIIISTTDKWGTNAEDALADQQIPVERIGLAEIAEAPIDWDLAWPADDLQVTISPARRHDLRPHQQTAVQAVLDGFAGGADRGKLIMACGTGKTFTALKLCEEIAAANEGRARILFLVPSISLLSQTLREWTAQTGLDLRAYAVCSDTKVSRVAEDINPHDVPLPATTDPVRLLKQMTPAAGAAGLTVVFSTYQSLPVVHQAQASGLPDFDLVVCDEAHRTTGVTLVGEDESNFVRVHDPAYIRAARRLYMTATPRLFDQEVKAKAEEHSAVLASMDDEATYGPEFHRLSFGTAVEHGLLTDYKVMVLTVDEEVIARPLQEQVANSNVEINLDDATKIVGCWNGLAKRAGEDMDGNGFPPDAVPMKRAVAFMRDIKSSKLLAGAFSQIIDAYEAANDDDALECSVRHVDGTFNALQRNAQLTWLKAPIPDGECRILSNARCLSEGVDVPALDAVMFMHPRNSVVDVVQSVGRVMRRAPGKDYGYIILPVAVPAGMAPEKALADNRRFKVVWQVLNALRAHDDRFNAMVNSIELNKGQHVPGERGNDQLLGGHIGPTGDGTETVGDGTKPADSTATTVITQPALFSLTDWRDAIYAKIVKNVGTRAYWEDWASDVADIAAAQQTRIRAILDNNHEYVRDAFDAFVTALRGNLNQSITEADAISMLSQHMITRPVFDALFSGYDFAGHNPVSQTMQAMVDRLEGKGLESETQSLDAFYDSVRVRAEGVTSGAGKQQIVTELYERFFKLAFKKQAESLGIVYTPVPIVDFILRAADDTLQSEFGKSITDEGVHILDGFTGTGTFIVRLLQSGIIKPADLARKYASELHANEIMLLAYYIAAVNIEATYHGLTGGDYQPFDGIILTDTFQISEAGDAADTSMFPTNNDRIEAQLKSPITVLCANPPYSVGQGNADDNNANLKYPTLDSKIEQTYGARSTARSQRTLYDSYIRAIRWGTDRLGDNGILAYVTNGGWIDANTADGIRLTLADEFATIYVYNLRGNARTAGELRQREKGNVFGSGGRTTIAIIIAVKNAAHDGPCQIRYRDIGDYLTAEEKLAIVDKGTIGGIKWEAITPNTHGDWVGARSEVFGDFTPIGDKTGGTGIFSTYSLGLATGRDAWIYNFSRDRVKESTARSVDYYNEQLARYKASGSSDSARYAKVDTTRFSWNRNAHQDLARGRSYSHDPTHVRVASYRPFTKQWCYFDRQLNAMVYQLPRIFPASNRSTPGIVVMGPRSEADPAVLMVDNMPDLAMFTYATQFFPRWTYAAADDDQPELSASPSDELDGYIRVDNITNSTLDRIGKAVGDESTSKDDIFNYVYAVLHSPSYREAFAVDLRKMLPRLPEPTSADQFRELVAAGRQLAELHVGYEKVDPYPLDELQNSSLLGDSPDLLRVTKMRWKSKTDHSAVVYNAHLTLAGIPEEAHQYRLGSRTALEWLIDRYQVTTDKKSGIVNDPNDWADEHGDPRYIVDLIKRVTTVSVETVKIVNSLPELDLG